MISYLIEFYSKAFHSISKADPSLDKLADKENEEQKETEKALEPFVERVKSCLSERIKEVVLNHRLTDTPAVVTTDANDMTTQMTKLFAAAGQAAPEIKYILELNLEHQLVKRTADLADDGAFGDWVELLLDQALLAERGRFLQANIKASDNRRQRYWLLEECVPVVLWFVVFSDFKNIFELARGLTQCVSFCWALRALVKALRHNLSWRSTAFRRFLPAICYVPR